MSLQFASPGSQSAWVHVGVSCWGFSGPPEEGTTKGFVERWPNGEAIQQSFCRQPVVLHLYRSAERSAKRPMPAVLTPHIGLIANAEHIYEPDSTHIALTSAAGSQIRSSSEVMNLTKDIESAAPKYPKTCANEVPRPPPLRKHGHGPKSQGKPAVQRPPNA